MFRLALSIVLGLLIVTVFGLLVGSPPGRSQRPVAITAVSSTGLPPLARINNEPRDVERPEAKTSPPADRVVELNTPPSNPILGAMSTLAALAFARLVWGRAVRPGP
jgi:hypothetical protein